MNIENENENEGALPLYKFCELYGISRTIAYIEMSEGRLEARKRGGSTLIGRAEAKRWFEKLPKAQFRLAGRK